jgi:hypothetical protein
MDFANNDNNSKLKFEFFKKFNYHFLPLLGPNITIEQAAQMSKCGGSCGGPYWPVRQSSTEKSEKFEQEAKRVAEKLSAEFTIVNQLPRHSPWWKKNKIYLRWIEHVSNKKQRKYGIKLRPALVVIQNENFVTIYDWKGMEKIINKFRIETI